jgi:hypothetical protein
MYAAPRMAKRKPAAKSAATKPERVKAELPEATVVASSSKPRRDLRRWIYAGLDVVFALVYGYVLAEVIPNRLPLASFHMWTIPIFTAGMAVGMLLSGRQGWWIAVVSGSLMLLSVFLLIVRIVISAAFLGGVYGAFGKGAVVFAFVLVALVVEVVGLLPIIQVKYLMSRAGRRMFGVA